jgi:hypothetical protein
MITFSRLISYGRVTVMNRFLLLCAVVMVSVLPAPAASQAAAREKPAIIRQLPPKPAVPEGTPPVVILSMTPSLLVTLDGPPQFALIKGAKPLLLRVVNTRVLLLTDAAGRFFLHLYDGFLEAASLDGPWHPSEKVPPSAGAAVAAARASGKSDLLEGKPDPGIRKKPSLRNSVIPWVYLSQVPAELIITQGTPDFISILGTRLFQARNTTGDLFCLQGDGAMFLLASGHWFTAPSTLAPWELVPEGGLPPEFDELLFADVKERVKAAVLPHRKRRLSDVCATAWFAEVVAGEWAHLARPGSAPAEFTVAPHPVVWCRKEM